MTCGLLAVGAKRGDLVPCVCETNKLFHKPQIGVIAAVVGVGFGWIASTKARVAPPTMISSVGIEPIKIMAGSANLPTEHFVDYSLIYP
jgi:hypothetical protein